MINVGALLAPTIDLGQLLAPRFDVGASVAPRITVAAVFGDRVGTADVNDSLAGDTDGDGALVTALLARVDDLPAEVVGRLGRIDDAQKLRGQLVTLVSGRSSAPSWA
jgi:hypothetical protein